MFICDICEDQQPPRVAVIPVTIEVRTRSYVDEESGEEIGFGHEIVRQVKACKSCAAAEEANGPIIREEAIVE